MPRERNSSTRLEDDVSAISPTRSRRTAATRRPTSPQPTINTRSLRKRAGSAPRGLWFEGKIRGYAKTECPKDNEKDREKMTFQITIQPSGRTYAAEPDEAMLAAGIRQGIGLPYGCKDGACGSCKCKKL